MNKKLNHLRMGLVYKGDYGDKQGHGIFYYDTGALKYKGGVKKGNAHGYGRRYREDGETIWQEGMFKDGQYREEK